MSCADYQRHEHLLSCGHLQETEIQVTLKDGCSGRLCPDCDRELGIRHWPDLAERVAGPAAGLDLLQLLRAMGR